MPKAGFEFRKLLFGILLLALPGSLFAVNPPALIHYQGVLRSATDEPLTGSYDMTFRFFDAESGGDELLVDQHLAANAQAVLVDGGLFGVELGGGVVTDGSGPMTYAALDEIFRDFDEVWLEVEVDGEVLAPRTRVMAAAYSLNATSAGTTDKLNGQPSSFYLDTSSTHQDKSGSVRFQAAEPAGATVEAIGDAGALEALSASNSYGATCKLAMGNVGADCAAAGWAGHFSDTSDGSYAYVGYASYGIFASGPGYGGYFSASGPAATGVSANAPAYGGYFSGTGASSTGVYGLSPNVGGHFRNSGSGAEAFIGNPVYGIDVYGPRAAQFHQLGALTDTLIGYVGYGVWSYSANGIYNIDYADGSYAILGDSPYKVRGNGSVSFVQNHPDDPNEVVIYHAPESSEVNVYTRGSGRLVNGTAEIDLDPTFAWTANPDIGLTAHLTPRGDPVALAVEEVTSKTIKVVGPKGSNVEFDYWVTGLRIGFEEMPAVSPKDIESAIPARASGDDIYAKAPGLRAFNALERYRAMDRAVGRKGDPDFKAAASLRDRIGIGHPVDPQHAHAPGAPAAPPPAAGAGSTGPEPSGQTASAVTGAAASATRDDGSAPASNGYPAVEFFPATSPIEAGEVVVLDPAVPGSVKRAARAADRNVVGVAVAPSSEGMVQVAFAAVHDVLVDATDRPISVGDLLTTSATEGAAMRADASSPGTILGKALEPLGSGVGAIRVLLMPR